jgi:hypothetical protein
MSELKPQHRHPVLFRKQRRGWSHMQKPMGMSELTYKRILLQRALISVPRPNDMEWGTYITGLANTVGLPPAKADLFLKGPLYRKAL